MLRVIVPFVITYTLVVTSCNNKREDSNTLNSSELDSSSDIEIDIGEFKRCFFMSCMVVGYEGNPCMDSIINGDVSLMGDFPLGVVGYRAVDSLAREVRKEIVEDSIMLITRRDYEMGKKRVFQICLKYYTSTRIDSVAREVLSRY